jgi:sec-independent protein translocase protein TatC
MAEKQAAYIPSATMTLLDHLRELRTRLVKVSVAVVLGLVLGFWLLQSTNFINYAILNFVGSQGVQITEVTEGFTTYISVALTIGIIMSMPVIIYQLLAFLTPGLTRAEKRWIYLGMPLVIGFFVGGIVFGWFITAPAAINFLVNFASNDSKGLIENKPALNDFLGILTRLLLINGIIFELPMVMFTLAKLRILQPARVAKYRRFIILAVVVIAAIVTPTGDPANLALIAVPMYLLFELGLILGRLA